MSQLWYFACLVSLLTNILRAKQKYQLHPVQTLTSSKFANTNSLVTRSQGDNFPHAQETTPWIKAIWRKTDTV